MPQHKLEELNDSYVPSKVEEEVLSYWKEDKTFEKSVESRDARDTYTFYDGPPFITGLPHYGHLLGSIVKDVVPRFQTMKGKRVERVWGWDCHGLPAENKVEQQLGINSKKEIETLGIDKFVAACKSYVNNVSADWEWYVDRIGRWVDFQNAYRTMDTNYMESVLWVFKQLYDKKLIYKGKRVSLFCPRCSTPISNFEVAMDNSYKDVTDPSVYIKLKLVDEDKYLLIWTTTPWTLPTNFAVGVDANATYSEVTSEGQTYYAATPRLKSVFEGREFTEVRQLSGSELVGKQYQPLYNYYAPKPNDHHVYAADFVSMEDGTGLVHIAPGFGEDDTELGKEHDLSLAESVDDQGHLKPEITVAEGRYFKAADKYIMADLTNRGVVFKQGTLIHSYPHCHRCSTTLIYKTQEAWYIDVQQLKDQLLATNESINWVPKYFKHGRFKLGIENAPDWNVSRTRYWGAPIPVWECVCGERYVIGSIKELEDLSGQKITDLHRPAIDEVVIKCAKCGKDAHRVPEVLDSWIEAASMPYAQIHYPFENQEKFKESFPADFITEYTGQLRAWFYVMHVISNSLYQTHCFNNCVVTGVILGNDGRKMSKNYGNYPDPRESLIKYGADALRLYLMGSPIVSGQDISISEGDWQEQDRTTLNLLWNSFKYFINYASLDNWQSRMTPLADPTSLDRWILARLNQTVSLMEKYLSAYELPRAVSQIQPFLSDLSTWYIRRSRDRVGPSATDIADRNRTYETLYTVFSVFLKAAAPVMPFVTEYLYRKLTGEESVHLTLWPEVDKLTSYDKDLLEKMTQVRTIAEMGNSERKRLAIAIKQPLSKLEVKGDRAPLANHPELVSLIMDELNVEDVLFTPSSASSVRFDTTLTDRLINKGKARELIRSIQQARKDAGTRLDEKVDVVLPDWPVEFEEDIKQRTLVRNLIKGESVEVRKIS